MENRILKGILNYYEDEELLLADGFDDAVIGVDESTMRIIYSSSRSIEILIERDNMTPDEALEYFDYNVKGAYIGDPQPIWCEDMLIE